MNDYAENVKAERERNYSERRCAGQSPGELTTDDSTIGVSFGDEIRCSCGIGADLPKSAKRGNSEFATAAFALAQIGANGLTIGAKASLRRHAPVR